MPLDGNPTRKRGTVCPSLTLRVVIEPLLAANPLNQQSSSGRGEQDQKMCVKDECFSPLAPFQSRQSPCAATEFVGFDSESLEHADVEIAKRRRVFGIER